MSLVPLAVIHMRRYGELPVRSGVFELLCCSATLWRSTIQHAHVRLVTIPILRRPVYGFIRSQSTLMLSAPPNDPWSAPMNVWMVFPLLPVPRMFLPQPADDLESVASNDARVGAEGVNSAGRSRPSGGGKARKTDPPVLATAGTSRTKGINCS